MMNKIVSIQPFKQEYASSFKSLNLEWIEVFFILEQEDIKILSNPEEYVLATHVIGASLVYLITNPYHI
ncbi:MAG: hypothetical protein ABS13_04695 [SAR86 cluster bacterium BACL1 MAG-121128-bin56]|nr:MAG: hypothetical protein ABS13_04695 [SAR86 cluster bacterium BACL1 MAG-121128-bin56]